MAEPSTAKAEDAPVSTDDSNSTSTQQPCNDVEAYDLVPPQPPLPNPSDDHIPPVVDGIDSDVPREIQLPDGDIPVDEDDIEPSDVFEARLFTTVREGDLVAFSELFARFHSRIEKASAGRKYRPLRGAWDAAADEIARAPDRIDLDKVSELVVEALRLGCESGKVALVDSCLDCIHRLFEYGHVGAAGDSTVVALDSRDWILDELVAIVCACLEVKDEDVYMRMVQTLLTSATRTKSGLHQSTLLAAVRTIYNIYLNAWTAGTRTTARVSLTQILNMVFSRMEAETAYDMKGIKELTTTASQDFGHDTQAMDVPSPAVPAEEGEDSTSDFVSILQKDAYLLFRALCKLSAKESIETNAVDSVGIRSKLLSLELVRNLISNSGPAFRKGERFIYALRQYLARSLLINCMWNSQQVVDVSFRIFEVLVRKDTLRPLLKTEIGALFDTVVFRFLESPTAGPMRKEKGTKFLSRLSNDRQTMADLFLNYDCDIESPKVFERIVNVISTVAREKVSTPDTGAAPSPATPGIAESYEARVTSLTALVQVVRSLREWSKPIEESKDAANPKVTATGGTAEPHVPVQGDRASDTEIVTAVVEDIVRRSVEGQGSPEWNISPASNRHGSVSSTSILTISEGSDQDTTRFEEALKARRDLAEGIQLFNSKPKRGIQFLVKQGRLQEDAAEIARFLLRTENLDATMVGEYIGDGAVFNVSVMHEFTDLHDFNGMTFDGALRLHLSAFRLPGEAQKIDRIMEKFASRFCECNPDIFANADAAYVLAYSTIMLHTDAHNDTIKNKMTKEDFIRNNRGINDGGDLDPTFLGHLYDRITTTEIRLSGSKWNSSTASEKKSLGVATATTMTPAQRAKQFEQESERLLARTKDLFTKKRKPTQDYTYYSATNVHLARLMFETAWYPVLAAISLNLEEASHIDSSVVPVCLDGFRHGIAISSTFGMGTAKDAFVSSLAKFTHLNTIAEMREKNIECVRMILAIAAMEGNNLGEQWVVIVRAISQLEHVRAVVSGNPGKFLLQKSRVHDSGARDTGRNPHINDGRQSASTRIPANTDVGKTTSPMSPTRVVSRRSSHGSLTRTDSANNRTDRIDAKAASLASTISEAEIERIFSNSSHLTASGVADFCGALCAVALEELSESPRPRLFCLQKIIELAYYNMDSRTRIQWGKIWDQMGPFFVSAMSHHNEDVAMYSVDALRQLASKFLEKDELSKFSFQKSFLKPFDLCYHRAKSAAIRELVLSCVSQIVLARASNIKSGWKSVFAVLALAAEDKEDSIMNFGWQIVNSIVRKYVGVLDDVFKDAIAGITAYARSKQSIHVSLAAIELLSGRCANSLTEGIRKVNGASDTVAEGTSAEKGLFSAENDSHIGSWFPILTGLAASMQDDRSPVRLSANNGLYKVLTDHGGLFSPSLWALIFRGVLAPVFDDVRHLSSSGNRNESAAIGEWATTTGSSSLRSLVDVFVLHFKTSRFILSDLLELIRSWALQETEGVAREGMSIFARLVMSAGHLFSGEEWDVVISFINRIFLDTMPHEIVGEGHVSPSKVPIGDTVVNGVNPSKSGNGSIVEQEGDDSKDEDASGTARVDEEIQSPGHEKAQTKINFRGVRAKCVVQLLLIELVQDVVVSFYDVLETDTILSMCKSLQESYTFAHDFNANIELRYSLWRTGFMNQVPNLLRQESNGLMAYLRILFWLYLDTEREATSVTEERVLELCEKVLRRYISSCEDAPSKSEERREVAALSPVVSFIVNSMLQMSVLQFEKHMNELNNILLDLLDCADDRDVRQTVTKLFRARLAPVVRKPENINGQESFSPQLPGRLQEKTVRAKLLEDGGSNRSADMCAALRRIGGVRSAEEKEGQAGIYRVRTCAPDEMLLAGVRALPFVQTAFVENDGLDLD